MKKIHIITLIYCFLAAQQACSQQDFLSEDYKIFGRKEPISQGSLFGVVGANTILINPANIAYITDNRINFGGGLSEIGYGSFISWMAPNVSISSASQTLDLNEVRNGQHHEKKFLHFCFGVSSNDLGFGSGEKTVALGVAVKRQADILSDADENKIAGGNAVSIDLGLIVKMKAITFEVAVVDLNNPELSDSKLSYDRGFIFGGRLTTKSGLTIALQGIGGNTYADSDFGLNLGAEQSFFNHRLVSRLQLTSFFMGSQATMQNISGGVGYRLNPKYGLVSFLQDLEFSYALSFLAMPNNVGTHLVAITKYF